MAFSYVPKLNVRHFLATMVTTTSLQHLSVLYSDTYHNSKLPWFLLTIWFLSSLRWSTDRRSNGDRLPGAEAILRLPVSMLTMLWMSGGIS